MAINKNILFDIIKTTLQKALDQTGFRNLSGLGSVDKVKANKTIHYDLIIYLIKTTIFNQPVKNCIIKGKKTDWNGLPETKSLFYTKKACGLPIGNLTSQLFGNIYMNSFDHYVKQQCEIKHYGRYVDDFVLIHKDKEYLKSLIPVLSNFLLSTLQLTLHPDKIYLQHFSKGVKYLGAVIKPHRIYISERTKNNFKQATREININIREKKELSQSELQDFISSFNSYLGIMKHYKTYKIRKFVLLSLLSDLIYNQVYISDGYCKLVSKIKPHAPP